MRRIYLAGFDVFAPDAQERGARMKMLCAERGWIGLYPLDNEADSAEEIYWGNLELIRQADCVAANVNPFRGCEPDSGTAFEIGYAAALGKQVWCYLSDARTMREKLGETDENGFSVEDFGSPLNLMLSQTAHIVEGDFADCLRAIAEEA
ncbi:MAG: nucleoside 2-deoxyribosyltransferase [Butyricicoccaceae bacterium]